MARLFRKGKKHYFVLRTCRDGVLDEIRAELMLGHGTPEDMLLQRLGRFDAERAESLEAVLEGVERALASPERIPLTMLVQLEERLALCRTRKTKPVASIPGPLQRFTAEQ